MKNLNEYIINSQIEQFLYDEIIESINEWWYLHKSIYGNLSDHQLLCERLGEFDNARVVMKRIMEYIDYVYKYEEDIRVKDPYDPTSYDKPYYDKEIDKTIDCTDIKGLYFKKVTIEIENTNKNIIGKYDSFKNNVVTIKIEINDSLKDWRDLVSYTILHELIHGYVDFNLKSKGKSLEDFITKRYSISANNLERADIFKGIRNCTYFLDPQERNAYIGTLRTTVEKICKNTNVKWSNLKFEEILENLKDEYIWKTYCELNKFNKFIEILKKFNDSQQSLVEYIYKKEFEETKTFNQIFKEIKTKFDKFKKQFMQVFAKSYCDYICSQRLPGLGWNPNLIKKLNEGYYFI